MSSVVTVLYADPRITVQRRVRWWRIDGRALFSTVTHDLRLPDPGAAEERRSGTDCYWFESKPSVVADCLQAYLRRESSLKTPSVACVAYDVGRDELLVLVSSRSFEPVRRGEEPPVLAFDEWTGEREESRGWV